jgi:hypothetical protein
MDVGLKSESAEVNLEWIHSEYLPTQKTEVLLFPFLFLSSAFTVQFLFQSRGNSA